MKPTQTKKNVISKITTLDIEVFFKPPKKFIEIIIKKIEAKNL